LADSTSLDTSVPGLDGGSSTDTPGATPGEPKASRGWLKMIKDAEKAFHEYQIKADNIDKQYANLERLANTTRDREIQLFWANISVMAPSCYSRPPVPVVTARWNKDQELPRTASEMLERATIITFEKEGIDGVMRLIRDDLVILARGAAWLRLETGKKGTRSCIDHADRKDFLYEPARNWKDCDWVAKRSWLTEAAAGKRFRKYSGDAYKTLQYSVRKDAESDADDGASKAGIWELWCKSQNTVVWVSEGANVCLDQGPPHLDLEDFFPCPRPAFGTLERRSLVPVPDMLFYKDQLEEINEITDRLAALTEAVRVRGFYPSGVGEVGDAIEAAVKNTSNNQVLVPISNWAGLGGGAAKDMIVWWPLEMVTQTITALIETRKELIQDVYEVTGLSDIMRGTTDASETLGAQQMKSQYGSVRIKDRQDELTRVARDITRISAEIMAQYFDGESLMEMSQMRLPSDAEIAAKAAPLKATLAKVQAEAPQLQQHLAGLQREVQQAQQDPEVAQLAQQNPQQAQQVLGAVQQQMQESQAKLQAMQQSGQQAEQQLQALEATVTIDAVLKLLREKKLRPFVLDIETDSTITPDENLAKQRATEYVTAMGGFLKSALPLVETNPQAAPVVAETMKFINAQFRAGRELQGVIDKFANAMEQKAQQPPPPNPAQIKAEADAAETKAKTERDNAAAQADAQAKAAQAAKDQAEAQAIAAEADTKAKDADLERRIAEQQEADAAQTRQVEAEQALLDARTKAADAETKRKIDEQRELDASAARQFDLENKATVAALQIKQQEEKHAQEMELRQQKHEQDMAAAAAKEARDAKVAEAAVAAHDAAAQAAKSKPAAEATK
jgi:hypothetical protein